MIFNDHSYLAGSHAAFSCSQPSWVNYDDSRLLEVYANKHASEYGTRLHEWAAETIKLGIRQPKSRTTLAMYVNDAITFKMEPEVVLYYSNYFYGTTDAISFRNDFLRIHDLKTGVTKPHHEQLELYAALFCLEYKKDPYTLKGIECRLYQCNDIDIWEPEPGQIKEFMDLIVHFNKVLIDNQE